MKTLFVMVGVPGSGKSTWIKNNKKENEIVISTDELRIELFNSLEEGNKKENQERLFNEVFSRLKEFCLDNTQNNCYYDATNLNRKKRVHLYKQIKSWNKEIKVVIVNKLERFNVILEQNNQRQGFSKVNEEIIERMFKNFQPFKIKLDCDDFIVVGTKDKATIMDKEMLDCFNNKTIIEHDSPYHKEDIKKHIENCLENVEKLYNEGRINKKQYKILSMVAMYHDVGKAFCKIEVNKDIEFVKLNGKHCQFNNHQNVSSMYFLHDFNFFLNKKRDRNNVLKALEVIYQHSNFDGLTEKQIKNNKLDKETIELISIFREIDSLSAEKWEIK